MSELSLEIKKQLLTKVAKLDILNTPQTQIAKACGISDGRVSQIMDDPEFIALRAELHSQQLEMRQGINEGLDAVEQDAIATILTHLNTAPDPEFALKAFKIANSASRNPGSTVHGNIMSPIQNGQAAIQLPIAYINKLQQINIVNVTVPGGEHRVVKRVDQMPIADVKNLISQAPVAEPIIIEAELANVLRS